MKILRVPAILSALLLLLLFACTSSAATTCPWLTRGSAATALGGDVTATVQIAESGEGSCTFTRQDGPKDVLKIVVSKAPLESCPAESPKPKGIGNEAALCRVERSPNEAMELLVSRVRDFHFKVSLSVHRDELQTGINRAQEAVKQIAEQVAGNLF
jgi:hypothetical protein